MYEAELPFAIGVDRLLSVSGVFTVSKDAGMGRPGITLLVDTLVLRLDKNVIENQ